MNYRADFIKSIGLDLSEAGFDFLQKYLDLLWEKKDSLNLTSARGKQEIWDRHICDGLVSAALIARSGGDKEIFAADYGAGAGYIGFAIAAVLPAARVSLIESLSKRCMFLEWIIYKAGLKNVKVLNMRADCGLANPSFDFTVERAMGKLENVLEICAKDLKKGGLFIAYQAVEALFDANAVKRGGVKEEPSFVYKLPSEDKLRKLSLFRKY